MTTFRQLLSSIFNTDCYLKNQTTGHFTPNRNPLFFPPLMNTEQEGDHQIMQSLLDRISFFKVDVST